ncbi:hypothetical protein GN244_ATG11752 [Phytophthora infestans]|uniref:Uncharacterized protein n=1 Tax=Phytophthora infestans TaxID=4787 RepID=A0A833WIB3_PHYIN|nr:hypothetical protein GN244_ATG11752 [Phytophthora infestans]
MVVIQGRCIERRSSIKLHEYGLYWEYGYDPTHGKDENDRNADNNYGSGDSLDAAIGTGTTGHDDDGNDDLTTTGTVTNGGDYTAASGTRSATGFGPSDRRIHGQWKRNGSADEICSLAVSGGWKV